MKDISESHSFYSTYITNLFLSVTRYQGSHFLRDFYKSFTQTVAAGLNYKVLIKFN